MQENHSDCSRVVQHALVLESGRHVKPDPSLSAQPADSALQSDYPQESVEPKSPYPANRASVIKEQDFSEAVAARIEAAQRGSANNQVVKRLQPRTIDSYRSAITDKLGNTPRTIDGYRSAI